MKSRRSKFRARIVRHAIARSRRAYHRCAKIKLAPRDPNAPLFPSLDFPDREFLNPDEAAHRLGCSLQHVYNLIIAGHIRALDISRPGPPNRRRFYRIPIESWRRFLRDHST